MITWLAINPELMTLMEIFTDFFMFLWIILWIDILSGHKCWIDPFAGNFFKNWSLCWWGKFLKLIPLLGKILEIDPFAGGNSWNWSLCWGKFLKLIPWLGIILTCIGWREYGESWRSCKREEPSILSVRSWNYR